MSLSEAAKRIGEQAACAQTIYKVDGGHWEGRYEIAAQLPGMTIRQLFTLAIATGLAMNPNRQFLQIDQQAKESVERADAVLEALAKGDSK